MKMMGSHENSLTECACMCGKGEFKVSYRVPDKGEGIQHLWEIDCQHCRGLYHIEKRGHLIGVVKKADEGRFIKIIYEIKDGK